MRYILVSERSRIIAPEEQGQMTETVSTVFLDRHLDSYL